MKRDELVASLRGAAALIAAGADPGVIGQLLEEIGFPHEELEDDDGFTLPYQAVAEESTEEVNDDGD